MVRKPRLGLPLQTLRNAPDAQEGRRLRGGVLDIDPARIETDGRLDDRLLTGVDGLRDSIARNGQRVPVLVRPLGEDRFALIYGRRRLEACRDLGLKVRAIVTETAEDAGLRDQLIENQDRRDLSFVERALVATALLEGDHLAGADRSNRGVAEVLNLTEAGVSQLLAVVRVVGVDLVRAIGAAPGIGRPRWEDLKRALVGEGVDRARLQRIAAAERAVPGRDPDAASDRAFLAVLAAARGRAAPGADDPAPLHLPGVGRARLRTAAGGRRLRLDLEAEEPGFVTWLEARAPELIAGLHDRWKREGGGA